MSKTGFWRDLFKAGRKQKRRVKLEDSSYADLTDTQACRFEELSNPGHGDAVQPTVAYALADAAERMGIDEQRLLEQSAQGIVRLYIAASGLTGHWQHSPAGRDRSSAPAQTLEGGFLALDAAACDELCRLGSTDVSILEREGRAAGVTSDDRVASDDGVAGRESPPAYFRLEEPCWVRRHAVVLLPPLPTKR